MPLGKWRSVPALDSDRYRIMSMSWFGDLNESCDDDAWLVFLANDRFPSV
jgi:hypothetical protein